MTNDVRPDLRAALLQFWELAHAWKPNTTVPEFHSGSDSEWRLEYLSQQNGARNAAVQSVLDIVAQSSPVPHEAPLSSNRFDCPVCGQGIKACEDGTCASCGADVVIIADGKPLVDPPVEGEA